MTRTFFDADLGGDQAAHWEEIGDACNKSGNSRDASVAYRNAANDAWAPDQRHKLYEQALNAGQSVGGVYLERAVLDAAADLRRWGRQVEADQKILDLIHLRIERLVTLFDGFPPQLAALDTELLDRLQIGRTKLSDRQLDDEDQLLAEVNFRGLALALRDWATRSESISVDLAKAYRQIAGQLDGATFLSATDRDKTSYDAEIAESGITLEEILDQPQPPLRTRGLDLVAGHNALWAAFWRFHEVRSEKPYVQRLLRAAEKVTFWHGSNDQSIAVQRMESQWGLDNDDPDEASRHADSAARLVKDDPWQSSAILRLKIEAKSKTDPTKAAQLSAERVETTKRLTIKDWIDAAYDAAITTWRVERAASREEQRGQVNKAATILSDVVRNLVDADLLSSADPALVKLASFYDYALQADGTQEALQVQNLRLEIARKVALEKDDLLHRLNVNVDVLRARSNWFAEEYRGGADRKLRNDAETATQMENEVAPAITEMMNNSQYLDAAQIVSRIPAFAKGGDQLIAKILPFAEKFRESSLYPKIAGDGLCTCVRRV